MKHTSKTLFADPPAPDQASGFARADRHNGSAPPAACPPRAGANRRPNSPAAFRGRLLALVIAALLAGGLAWAWFQVPHPIATFTVRDPRVGEVVRVRRAVASVRLSGSVDLPDRQVLSAPEAGLLRSLVVAQGQRVMAGQALFRIEPVELAEDLAALKRSRDQTAGRLELALSRASLDKDRTKRHIRLLSAAAAQARREAELQERLQAQGLASDQDRATALLELERQEAALSDAGADEALAARQADLENAAIARDREVLDRQIALAEARLAACRGRSPVDAVVLRINGEAAVPGAFVNRFQPLVEIAATGRAQAVFDLPLASRAAAAPGQAVRVLIQGREWPGRVAWVGGQLGGGRAADGGNGLRLVIDLESQEGAPGGPGDGGGHETSLVPGTPASLTLLTGVRRDVLALPLGPFLSSGKGLVAWRIEDGSAAKLAVRLNGNYDGMVVVEAGLAEGDRVLLSGHEDFAAFDRVEVAWTALPTIEKISSQEKNDD